MPGSRVIFNPLNIAAIGAGGRAASVFYPNVTDWQGYTNYVEEQDWEYLSLLDGILLFGHEWRSVPRAEKAVLPYLESGKTIYEEVGAAAGRRMFDEDSERVQFSGFVTVRNAPGVALLPPEGMEIGPFGFGEGLWTAAVMTGDGRPLLVADINGEEHVVVSETKIGAGRMVNIDLSLTTHAEAKRDHTAAELGRLIFGYDESDARRPLALPTSNLEWGNSKIEFDYQAGTNQVALLSLTYFPAWRATVDGKAVDLYRHERLTLMELPAGDHTVRLTYGATPTQLKAASLTLLVPMGIGGVFVPWRQYARDPNVRRNLKSPGIRLRAMAFTRGWIPATEVLALPRIPESPSGGRSQFRATNGARTPQVHLEPELTRLWFEPPNDITGPTEVLILQNGRVAAAINDPQPGIPVKVEKIDGLVRFAVRVPYGKRWLLTVGEESDTAVETPFESAM